jgi:hypothetical protein
MPLSPVPRLSQGHMRAYGVFRLSDVFDLAAV